MSDPQRNLFVRAHTSIGTTTLRSNATLRKYARVYACAQCELACAQTCVGAPRHVCPRQFIWADTRTAVHTHTQTLHVRLITCLCAGAHLRFVRCQHVRMHNDLHRKSVHACASDNVSVCSHTNMSVCVCEKPK